MSFDKEQFDKDMAEIKSQSKSLLIALPIWLAFGLALMYAARNSPAAIGFVVLGAWVIAVLGFNIYMGVHDATAGRHTISNDGGDERRT